jgi:hypothetical protein
LRAALTRAGLFLAVARAEGLARALAAARRHVLGEAPGELNRPHPPSRPDAGHPLAAAWAELARRGAFGARRRLPVPGPVIVAVSPPRPADAWSGRAEALEALWPGATMRRVDAADLHTAVSALQEATHVVFLGCARDAATAALLCEARRLSLPVLLDLDAPRMSLPECQAHAETAGFPRAPGRSPAAAVTAVLELMSAADAVSAATPALVGKAARLCPRPVWLAGDEPGPDDLALGARLAAAPRRPGPPRLALALSAEAGPDDLAPLLPALEAELAARPGTRLLAIGPLRPGLLPRRLRAAVDPVPCRTRAEILAAAAAADAVLIPLADTPFNRDRSAAPALAAAAAARPVAASPTGAIGAFVRHGRTGLLARGPADWKAALSALADPERARAMGAAARAHVAARAASGARTTADPALAAWGLT